MQARYYDPVIGRFYSNDPIGFRDVHSFNRYAYANNNPYKYTDPDGKSSLALCLTGPIGCGVGVGITIFAAIVTIDTAVRPGINIPAMLNESSDLVDDLKKGKDPVPGVEGERGGLMGTPEQADEDWDKIKNSEGAEVKDDNNIKLSDGSNANRHTSARPYPGGPPAGTDTIKIYKSGESAPVYTGRYPEEKENE